MAGKPGLAGRKPKTERARVIVEMREAGKSVPEIARLFEITRTRIYQILAAARAAKEGGET